MARELKGRVRGLSDDVEISSTVPSEVCGEPDPAPLCRACLSTIAPGSVERLQGADSLPSGEGRVLARVHEHGRLPSES